MWEVRTTNTFERDKKHYLKRHRPELLAVSSNLERYFEMLTEATNPELIVAGFLHPEPLGIVAVDQRGGKGSLAQTRLYTFPDHSEKILYLIKIGDKNNQSNDIRLCEKFVRELIGDKPKTES